jgi:serine protease Do
MKSPTTSNSNRRAILWATLFIITAHVGARAEGLLDSINSEVSALYEKSKDAIVKVHAQRQLQLGNAPFIPSHRVGTGFLVAGDGLLLTAAAVVEGADSCWIDWRGEQVPAKIIGRDQRSNVAVLKVDPVKCVGEGQQMPFLPEGNSDELRVGSMVIAIGFPYELPSAPVVGFVSGFDIKRGSHVFVTSHIRAVCKLSPGQGGGPLLNTRGEVVGIAVAARMDDQCYALPINAAKKVSADMLECGQARHGWVGLGVGERTKRDDATGAQSFQVYVQQVFSNTPAAEAGFRDKDILIKIYTNEIRQIDDLLNTIFYHRNGDRVQFTILRDGQQQQVSLVIGTQPHEETADTQVLLPFPTVNPQGQFPTVVPAAESR